MNSTDLNGQPAKNQLSLEIVSATRYAESDFWSKSALGQSLQHVAYDPKIITRINYENRRGLSEVFNESIQSADAHDVLLFVHDDVWLHDFFFVDRLIEAVETFDIIGVAGNRRRSPAQVAWFAPTSDLAFDHGFLSGVVGHGDGPLGTASFFGPAPAECELLDGLLLAAKKSTLNTAGVLFDPIFRFHFYDLDFCRSARAAGLRLGTYPISVTHQSRGNFNSEQWLESRRLYLSKWEPGKTDAGATQAVAK